MTRQLTSLFLNSCVLFCFSLLIFAARYFTKHVKCLLFIIIESAKYYLRRFPHTLGLVCSSLFSTFNFIVFLVAFFCQWYKTILLGGALLSLRFTLHLWHKRVKVDCLRNCEIGRRPEFHQTTMSLLLPKLTLFPFFCIETTVSRFPPPFSNGSCSCVLKSKKYIL